MAAKVSIVWNILGSIDLVAAIFLGITTSSPQLSAVLYHTYNTHPTMTTMPWVLYRQYSEDGEIVACTRHGVG